MSFGKLLRFTSVLALTAPLTVGVVACGGGAEEAKHAHVKAGEMPQGAQHAGQAVMVVRRFASALTAAGCPGPKPFPGVAGDRLERGDRVLPGGASGGNLVLCHGDVPG